MISIKQQTNNEELTAQPRLGMPTRALHLWHLLSLDAPTVATAWTWFIARATGTRLPISALAAMFLAVWTLYAADRLLDARDLFTNPLQTANLEARHLFHHRHATRFLTVILITSIALAALLRDLLPEALRLYAILGTLLFAWFLLIHARAAAALRLPKELAVGIFFPAAVFIPTIARHPELRLALLPHAILFSSVCTLNCLSIYAWEHPAAHTPDSLAQAHWTTRTAIRHLSTIAAAIIILGIIVAIIDRIIHYPNLSPLALGVALSALMLLILNQARCPILSAPDRATGGEPTPLEAPGCSTHAVSSHEWAFAKRTALSSPPQNRHLDRSSAVSSRCVAERSASLPQPHPSLRAVACSPLTLRAAADLALLPPLPLLLLFTKSPRPSQPNFNLIARPYRYLEYLTLGRTLQNCRTHHLPALLNQKSALILGDGDGRFLAQLLHTNLTVQAEAIDTSSTMLTLLKQSCKAEAARLQTHQTSALAFTPTRTYDLVTTHFFLDCLTQPEVETLIQNLIPALEPQALWLVSDFRIPTGLLRLPAKLYVRSLYLAFRLLTGLRTTALPDHATPLTSAGLTLISENRSLAGLLTTQLWQYTRSTRPANTLLTPSAVNLREAI